MKSFSVVLALTLLFPVFCFSQTQTGNASYNDSKTGFTISHSSLSFNSRVRVTNLKNNRSVEAIVNGRIPISADRIADISKDAGDALEMSKTGMTMVQIEGLPFDRPASVSEPAPVEKKPPDQNTGPKTEPRQTEPRQTPAAAPETRTAGEQTIRVVTEPQYIQVPAFSCQERLCSNTPLLLAIFFTLILALILLVAILFLISRRLPFWPWHYPVWYRRHVLYVKKRRN